MAKSKSSRSSETAEPAAAAEYTVVARRYRPQQFAELIGQEHVAQALVNALNSGRVAHAYLFTGARGVGKTSAARILAKALNCEKGPTATPCDECDSCKAIAEGQDVDVQEIDGASNNKVEEVRDLRQNVGFRPTRGRYKIYIIDEVHMLSTGAFNALLKTLEEPPAHVKFILATTELQKIPITILSRCQRFDFAHVGAAKIFEQLKSIVTREGYEADEAALRIIAKRANGSMRDSQSLLDQLLASQSGRLTAENVQAVLGTAGDDRVLELATAIINRDPKTALNLVGQWFERGLQVGELVDQMIDYWRGLMLLRCAPDLPLEDASPTIREAMVAHAKAMSLDTVLAGLEVWTSTKARIRGSGLAHVLLEMAIARLSRLEEVLSVSQLLQEVKSNNVPAVGSRPASRPAESGDSSKKKPLTAPEPVAYADRNGHAERAAGKQAILTEETVEEVWSALQDYLADRAPILANLLKSALSPAIFGPNLLEIRFHPDYNHQHDACNTEQSLARLREALKAVCGQPVDVRLRLVNAPRSAGAGAALVNRAADRRKTLMELPLFQRAAVALGAQIWHLDESFDPTAEPRQAETATEVEPEEEDDSQEVPDEV
jgi:DNA polymerase-3 subunit gamma/tau